MKKILYFSAALLILAISTGRVSARLTGTDPGTDVWCAGPSGAEICVDASGNLIPTTNNDTTIGTSALAFATAYVYDLTLSDDLTVADDVTITGDLLKTPIASAVLGAGGTISTVGGCGGLIRVTVTDNRTTDTTNSLTVPTAGNVGCIVIIANAGGGTITIDDNAADQNFGGANVVLGTDDTATYVQSTTVWLMIGSSDN